MSVSGETLPDELEIYIVPKENKDIPFGVSSEMVEVVSEIETMSSPKDLEVPMMKQKTFLVGGPNGLIEVLRLIKRSTGAMRLPNIRQNMIVYADQYMSFNIKTFDKLKKDGINVAVPVKKRKDEESGKDVIIEAVESLKVLDQSLKAIQMGKEFIVLNLKNSEGKEIIIRRINEGEIKNQIDSKDPKRDQKMKLIFLLKNPWAGTGSSPAPMKLGGIVKFDKSYEEDVSMFDAAGAASAGAAAADGVDDTAASAGAAAGASAGAAASDMIDSLIET